MQKPKLKDPLLAVDAPDRPFYELGVMLDAGDFTDEQTYHRGRLARALAAIHGAGTIAGLQVEFVPRRLESAPGANDARAPELRVTPGLAIDPFGRLIELPLPVCIDLDRWWGPAVLDDDTDPETRARIASQRLAYKAALGGLIADVFVRFVACGRAPTPAFARGAGDALDATVYGRIRDGAEVRLVPRSEDPPGPLAPADPWAGLAGADLAARLRALHERQLSAAHWQAVANPPGPPEVPVALAGEAAPGLPSGGDPRAQWVFLARVPFATAAPIGDNGPRPSDAAPAPAPDNFLRTFVLVPGAIPALVAP